LETGIAGSSQKRWVAGLRRKIPVEAEKVKQEKSRRESSAEKVKRRKKQSCAEFLSIG